MFEELETRNSRSDNLVAGITASFSYELGSDDVINGHHVNRTVWDGDRWPATGAKKIDPQEEKRRGKNERADVRRVNQKK